MTAIFGVIKKVVKMDSELFKVILQVLGALVILLGVIAPIMYLYGTIHDINSMVEDLHDKFIEKEEK